MSDSKNTTDQFKNATEWDAAIRENTVQILSVFGFGDDDEFIDQFCTSLGPDAAQAFSLTKRALPVTAINPRIQKILDYCGCDDATSKIIRQNVLSSIMTGEYSDDKKTDFNINENESNVEMARSLISQTRKMAYNEVWLPLQTALWDQIREAEKLIDNSNLRDRTKRALKKKALEQGPTVAIERANMLMEETAGFMTNCITGIEELYAKAGVNLPKDWLDLPPDQLPALPEQNGLS